MNSLLKLMPGILLGCSVLNGCLDGPDSSTSVNTKLNLKKADLVGIWEHPEDVAGGVGGMLGSTEYRVLFFSDTGTCFFIYQYPTNFFEPLVSGDTVSQEISQSGWSVDSNSVTFTEDPYLLLPLSETWPRVGKRMLGVSSTLKSVNGIHYLSWTYSSMDTLAYTRNIGNQDRNDSLKTVSIHVLKAPYEFTVLSIQSGSDGKELHLTDKHCYEQHIDQLDSIDSLCEVRVFFKRDWSYLSTMVQSMDTVPTTEAYFPKGIDAPYNYAVTIVPIARGAETW